MPDHQPPRTNHVAATNPQFPIPNHQLCATPNPQSPIPNHHGAVATTNPQSPIPNHHGAVATTNPQSPIPNHQLCATPNPQSPIPNHWRLYAALYRPPRGEDGGELAAVAREFSPRYQLHHPDLVVIDVAGLHRLLGPACAIGDELRKAVSTRGIRAHV